MIDNIETVIMDFTNINNQKEIQSYITNQLGLHFPKPELLIYDYIITKTGNKKNAMISYAISDIINNISKSRIEHPHLLFKHLLKKNGNYVILYSTRILSVNIENRVISKIGTFYLDNLNLLTINDKTILISDKKNIKLCKKTFFVTPLSLESMYKKCKKDMFITKKRRSKPLLLFIIPLIVLILYTINYSLNLKLNKKNLEELIVKYKYIQQASIEQNEAKKLYEDTLERVYIKESHITPDLYDIFYELYRYNTNYRIIDLNYSTQFLTINAITNNSITLLTDLNLSKKFNFKQNRTVTKNGFEQINFSGDVICP